MYQSQLNNFESFFVIIILTWYQLFDTYILSLAYETSYLFISCYLVLYLTSSNKIIISPLNIFKKIIEANKTEFAQHSNLIEKEFDIYLSFHNDAIERFYNFYHFICIVSVIFNWKKLRYLWIFAFSFNIRKICRKKLA